MNAQLEAVARQLDLQQNRLLRFAFALACARRVEHLLEDPRAAEALKALQSFVARNCADPGIDEAREAIAGVARSHAGSRSLDGAAHAAVSATNAVANALAGRALDAASYSAYAKVYAYGGYAVSDPSAFEEEFRWQVAELQRLAGLK
ncbi:hypothetical protein [Ramlibacter sp. PS4R-6]|uniref:hypothetical protein n=1 Tax=Ramlibacter sp. PS4R-6 TaxID=3133438 RepID=UPI0030B41ACC